MLDPQAREAETLPSTEVHSSEPRVLLVTERTLGEGHRSAARALAEAFRRLVPGLSPVIATTLPAHVEWVFNAVYGHTLTKNPALWGAAYETELWTGPLMKPIVSNPIRRNARRLVALYKPHIVLATHALPVHAFARMRKRGAPYVLGVAITDFGGNSFWTDKYVDAFFVANEEIGRRIAARYRLPEERFVPTGIPIHPVFAAGEEERRRRREEKRRALGIGEEPLILLFGGGEGLFDFPSLIHALDKLTLPFSLLVLTGRNAFLWETLRTLRGSLRHKLFPYGFLEDPQEIFDIYLAGDLLISKAGGLTVSEALAVGLPMILHRPIPGQESRNTNYLLEKEAALYAPRPDILVRTVEFLLREPERRRELAERARSLGKPDAALGIARHMLTLYAESCRSTQTSP